MGKVPLILSPPSLPSYMWRFILLLLILWSHRSFNGGWGEMGTYVLSFHLENHTVCQKVPTKIVYPAIFWLSFQLRFAFRHLYSLRITGRLCNIVAFLLADSYIPSQAQGVCHRRGGEAFITATRRMAIARENEWMTWIWSSSADMFLLLPQWRRQDGPRWLLKAAWCVKTVDVIAGSLTLLARIQFRTLQSTVKWLHLPATRRRL